MTRLGLTATVLTGHWLFGVGDQSPIEDRWRSNRNTRPLPRRGNGISAFTALAVSGLIISLATPTQASPINNLIMNPGFVSTNSHTTQIQVNNPLASPEPTFTAGADLGPWTVDSGFVVLFGPHSGTSGTNADCGFTGCSPMGAPNHFNGNGGFCLWGPGSGTCGGANPNGLTIGPSGGNFLAMDGAIDDPSHVLLRATVSQMITGLEVGVPTTLEFNWATGQQAGFQNPTTQQLQVSLGSQTMTTAMRMTPNHGFDSWQKEVFTFTPTSTSEVLSFLAIGTPAHGASNAGPPFILLDGGVSLQAPVPEPATWTEVGISFLSIAGFAYRRYKSVRVPDKTRDA